ncbi:glycoside hydrolase family protein [Tritrichomonas foetus]|uniref:Glycoside hydrolase family protein n=1 Tax=Tritrichomonas foetus TaxID=1144522 RepID=A0A1J4KLX9_9EUKA|nr:glycoside hydrolase family protein [Tritrichomonas foetus]|eukprot:OHT11944.1 glycoside hydrolase family protein [Tritrichomonas foetus]
MQEMVNSTQIDPPFWWSGMKNPVVQLFIYGPKISLFKPKVDSESIIIVSTVLVESPNYIIINLDTTDADPQTFAIEFSNENDFFVMKYELKQREPHATVIDSFDSSDVVYLLMPDRFSKGSEYELPGLPKDTENDVQDPTMSSSNNIPTTLKSNDETTGKFIDPNFPHLRARYHVDRGDPNARHGGDLIGVRNHLDYFCDLGITTVWMTPIFENDMEGGSYHGYASTDFYKVDPRFGTNEEYLSFVEECHKRGLKVVMDMVFNHCGSNHIWYIDTPSKDWFNCRRNYVPTTHEIQTMYSPYGADIDKGEFNDGYFVDTMPDLNHRNQIIERYLVQNSIWWIENTRINGIRQDTYPYCDQPMMSRWIKSVQDEYPGFNIVGEVWLDSAIGISYFQNGNTFNELQPLLPTVMDFQLMSIIGEVVEHETSFNDGFYKLYRHLNFDYVYPDVYKVLRFLDNHDTDRFLKGQVENLYSFKQGMTVLLTIPGIPQIYYGTEILMYGTKGISDGYVRSDFPGG